MIKNYLTAVFLLIASCNVAATGDGIPTSAAFIYLLFALYVLLPLIVFVLINWLVFKCKGKRAGLTFLAISTCAVIAMVFHFFS